MEEDDIISNEQETNSPVHGVEDRERIEDSILNRLYGVSDKDLEDLERQLMDGTLGEEDEQEESEEEEGEAESGEGNGEGDDGAKAEDEPETLSSFLKKKQEGAVEGESKKVEADREAELTRKAAEIEAREQALLDMRELLLNNGKQVQSEGATESEEDSFKAFSKDLIEGEDEKAADKLKSGVDKLMKGKVAPVEAKVEELHRDFEKRVEQVARRIDLERRWESALGEFTESRKDITEDTFLSGLFQQNLRTAAEAGLPPEKAVKLASAEIDSWIEKRFGKPASVVEKKAGLMDKKEAAKRSSLKPSGISKSESKADPEFEQETPSQIIERMRRERGVR